MLQTIRKNMRGTMAKVVIGIIIVPFALFGIETLLGGGGLQFVAEVNGERITVVQLQQQINQHKRRLIAEMGDAVDPAMLEDRELEGPALEFLVRKTLLMQEAADYGLAVSDERIGAILGGMEAFQSEGQFNPELYRRIISDLGDSPAGFQRAMRESLLSAQLRDGIAGSEFATADEAERLAVLRREQRDVRYMILPLEEFRRAADPSLDEMQAWYEAHADSFVTQEAADLAYIELRREDFQTPAEEAELRAAYEAERDSYSVPAERRVSHILFEQGDASREQLDGRIAAAAERLAAGEDFAALAGELSDDVGSAGQGGDLGFTAGDSFPPAMEAAIRELAAGEVSAPVETDAGWHILQVTEARGGQTRDFAEVRGELAERLEREAASEALISAVERLKDLAFNAPDLAGPAAELGLAVARADGVLREAAGEDSEHDHAEHGGLFADYPVLVNAAFSPEVAQEGYNSEVLEIEPERFVVLRALNHYPPRPRPFSEAQPEIRRAIADAGAREAMERRAQELLADLRGGKSLESVARGNGFEWQVELGATRDNQFVPPAVLDRLFQLPPPAAGAGSFEFVWNEDGDLELFELAKVKPADPARLDAAERAAARLELAGQRGARTDALYQRALLDKADIRQGG